ncbi:SDR family NAD(P)-dependent oxidoreductase [Yimella sp. RIT 621]|uniref:SDR family NAD(P)-dependent oxidoreductase n=1 Tax=Yimella sp. RIT 621 TaxID=2510323 RepID=UPI001F0E7083|nr:SDR family NAD(P)-dependent oxidoreductase [Yimella sp. RIT 621]
MTTSTTPTSQRGPMAGRTAMLTGAARGIGAATARLFAERGADVLICDVLPDEAGALVDELRATGIRAEFRQTDVGDPESVRSAVEYAVTTFGGLDYAFNNAGIFASAPLADLEIEEWQRVVDVNLSGIFYCLKYQIRHMATVGSGAIVNTASVWSFAPSGGQTAYVATKHGVVGLTKNASFDHGAQGIRVNAIAPGPIQTPMTADVPEEVMKTIIAKTAENRYGQPEEVAQAAIWLCSDESSYVNGTVLAVDGGWLNG